MPKNLLQVKWETFVPEFAPYYIFPRSALLAWIIQTHVLFQLRGWCLNLRFLLFPGDCAFAAAETILFEVAGKPVAAAAAALFVFPLETSISLRRRGVIATTNLSQSNSNRILRKLRHKDANLLVLGRGLAFTQNELRRNKAQRLAAASCVLLVSAPFDHFANGGQPACGPLSRYNLIFPLSMGSMKWKSSRRPN